MYMSAGAHGGQERVLDPLEQAINNLTWVQEIQLMSSTKAAQSRNHWAISTAPEVAIYVLTWQK